MENALLGRIESRWLGNRGNAERGVAKLAFHLFATHVVRDGQNLSTLQIWADQFYGHSTLCGVYRSDWFRA